MSALVRFSNVTIRRGDRPLVRDAWFDLHPGERLAVLGPSGCGKSTLLESLLGSRKLVAKGIIEVGGCEAGSPGAASWVRANAAVVFQGLALFEGRSVAYNLDFPLRHVAGRGSSRRERRGLYLPLLESLGFAVESCRNEDASRIRRTLVRAIWGGQEYPLLRKPVDQFSGGERKRIALARALVSRPRLLLLDEPTSGLDEGTAVQLGQLLRGACERDGVSVLCITHDPKFADALGCRRALIDVATHAISVEARSESDAAVDPGGGAPQEIGSRISYLFYASEYGHRFATLLLSNALICLPASLLVGAGLVAQAVHGPAWLQSFLARGVVSGVFLGLGTIVPALLVIGHSGSGVAAELAQRKNAKQLAYLHSLGISPFWFLAVPVVATLCIAMPVLTGLSEFAMLRGAILTWGRLAEHTALTQALFADEIARHVRPTDPLVFRTLVKAFSHGFVIGMVSVLAGMLSRPGEMGIRRAVSVAVIVSSCLVILADVLWSILWITSF